MGKKDLNLLDRPDLAIQDEWLLLTSVVQQRDGHFTVSVEIGVTLTDGRDIGPAWFDLDFPIEERP